LKDRQVKTRKEVPIPTNKASGRESPSKLQRVRKILQAYITQPIVVFLAKTSITPNMVTWFGFFLILAAAALAGEPLV